MIQQPTLFLVKSENDLFEISLSSGGGWYRISHPGKQAQAVAQSDVIRMLVANRGVFFSRLPMTEAE